MARPNSPPKVLLSVDRSPNLTTCLIPGPVRPTMPNGIRIRSAVFHNALDRQTDRPTDRSRENLTTIGRCTTRATWPKMHCGYFDTARKGNHCSFFDTNSGCWAMPAFVWNLRSKSPTPFETRRLRQISAYNVSAIRDSEKSSIMTNRKSTTGCLMSYRWNAYVTPKSPKGWTKKRFFVCFF